MPPRKTPAVGPRPFRRSARNAVATATPALSTSPKTPEQPAADRKSYSAPGLNAGDSSVDPSPCSVIPNSCRDAPEVENSDPGFGCGDRGERGGGTEFVDEAGGEGSGDCGVKGDVSTIETAGVGQIGERRKRIVRRIVKVVKVVKKRVPKKVVIEGHGEGCDGAECKQEVGKSFVAIPIDKNRIDSVAMEVDGGNGNRLIKSIARATLPVRVECSIGGEFNVGDVKESTEIVDSCVQVTENRNGDIDLASVDQPVGFGNSVHREYYEGYMKECAEKEDHGMEDRKRIELGHVISEEGVNKDAVAAGSDRTGCSDNVVSSAESKEGVDEVNIGSSAGSKEEADELNCGLRWSGEMEALERKKRRKTEIFVGGLAKDATEDDVRKVFEEVGKIVDARVVKSSKTGKSKGYAFVRYAVATDAKKALQKYNKVKICGKECGTRPVEGNDTIFLGNISKQWKEGDVTKLLQDNGVHKIDKVTVLAHPTIADQNRGFTFVEFESNKDADVALKKLQKQNELGKLKGIKVSWAKPLSEPDEEDMQKVKSVYAEFIPLSWDEERVRGYFKKFGEIENVTLARNLPSSRRKDFAFVTFSYREAAITCVQSLKNEQLQDGLEVNVKVSLAKPLSKSTSMKKASRPFIKPTAIPKSSQWVKANEHKGPPTTTTNYLLRLGESTHSRTSEAVQFLREREQTSWLLSQTRLASGSPNLDRSYKISGSKRPLSIMENDRLYSDLRGHSYTHIGHAQLVGERPDPFSRGNRMTSFPQHQPQIPAHLFAHHYLDGGSSMQRNAPYSAVFPHFTDMNFTEREYQNAEWARCSSTNQRQ